MCIRDSSLFGHLSGHIFAVTNYYYNEPSFQVTEPRHPTLAMGEIGGVVALLPIRDHLQYPVRVKCTRGQDTDQEQLYLGQRQARRVCFSRRRTRTKKKWAKIPRVR